MPLSGWELVIVVGVLILLFGAKRLPEMARSIGQSARVFKGEMKGLKSDEEARQAPAQPQPAPQALPSVQQPAQPAQPAAQPAQADQAQNRTEQSS